MYNNDSANGSIALSSTSTENLIADIRNKHNELLIASQQLMEQVNQLERQVQEQQLFPFKLFGTVWHSEEQILEELFTYARSKILKAVKDQINYIPRQLSLDIDIAEYVDINADRIDIELNNREIEVSVDGDCLDIDTDWEDEVNRKLEQGCNDAIEYIEEDDRIEVSNMITDYQNERK